MSPSTIEIVGTLCLGLAVVHTFLVNYFQRLAARRTPGSAAENLLHLLGEVEVVFCRDRHRAKQRLNRHRIDVRAVPNRRLAQGCDRHYAHTGHERCLVGVAGRHHDDTRVGEECVMRVLLELLE